ncbi:MAG: response regulator [Verrucomicrobiota bacterium]|jgi:CheY-like chemotaxis protein
MPQLKPITILLVEDNADDVRLTQEALRGARMIHQLQVTRDGVEALAFLRRQEPFADSPRPDLILLDLNMPRKDGREVLMEIKGDEDLKRIPVVVFTTSQAEEDILRSYDLHANAYITKPVDLGQFLKVLQSLEEFWVAVVTLPPNRPKTS